MKMNPQELIKLGLKLKDDNNYFEESRYRSAISRIYYGTLHYVRLVKHLMHIDTTKLHSDLIDKVNDIDIVLGNYLENMKGFRTEADYYLQKRVDKNSLNAFLVYFNKVIESIERESDELYI